MLLVPCPHCGPRAELEFLCAGEGTTRPDPAALDAAAWASHVFTRSNHRGPVRERWWHAAGCRRWIELVRDTSTNRFLSETDGGHDSGAPAP